MTDAEATVWWCNAAKVFDKYIKRGAPMELSLESALRNQIVTNIDKAGHGLFDEAQNAVFHSMLLEVGPTCQHRPLRMSYMQDYRPWNGGDVTGPRPRMYRQSTVHGLTYMSNVWTTRRTGRSSR